MQVFSRKKLSINKIVGDVSIHLMVSFTSILEYFQVLKIICIANVFNVLMRM